MALLAKPTVLIIEAKSENVIKQKAIDSVIKKFENIYENYLFEKIEIDFSKMEEIEDLKIYIEENKDELVYIIAPSNTSEYKQIVSFLPKKIPIITEVGTAMVLNKEDSWVTTVSALAKGKAIAIEKLIKQNKNDALLVLFDETIDEYTQEILEYFSDSPIDIIYMDVNKIDNKELNIKNRLIFLASKTNSETKKLYDKIYRDVLLKYNIRNDLLLLKVSEKDTSSFTYKHHIYYLSYDIPGYLPDFRLLFYKHVDDLCDSENINTTTCFKIYGKEFQQLYMFLDLGLYKAKTDEKIQTIREQIYKNITQYDTKNIYYDKVTKKIMQFKKDGNFYYNSLIENGITNYYIVRLDKNIDYLNSFQITTQKADSSKIKSQDTVYLDFKLEKLLVTDLSASATYIEGTIRIVSTNKDIDLKEDFHINFDQNSLKQSSIKLIDQNMYTKGEKNLYESFYTVKGYFNIENDLWKFPYDKQKVYISFTPKDFVNNAFVVQLQENDDTNIDFGEWTMDYIKPFLSNEIVKFKKNVLLEESSVYYKPISNLEIQITRNTSLAIMLKFVLPVLIIITLIIITYNFFHKTSTLDSSVDIYISSFAGIISIYFIFNLLIDIENLIIFDIAFLFFMILSIIYIILNMMRYENGELKEKHL